MNVKEEKEGRSTFSINSWPLAAKRDMKKRNKPRARVWKIHGEGRHCQAGWLPEWVREDMLLKRVSILKRVLAHHTARNSTFIYPSNTLGGDSSCLAKKKEAWKKELEVTDQCLCGNTRVVLACLKGIHLNSIKGKKLSFIPFEWQNSMVVQRTHALNTHILIFYLSRLRLHGAKRNENMPPRLILLFHFCPCIQKSTFQKSESWELPWTAYRVLRQGIV